MSNIKCQMSVRLNFCRSVPLEFLRSFCLSIFTLWSFWPLRQPFCKLWPSCGAPDSETGAQLVHCRCLKPLSCANPIWTICPPICWLLSTSNSTSDHLIKVPKTKQKCCIADDSDCSPALKYKQQQRRVKIGVICLTPYKCTVKQTLYFFWRQKHSSTLPILEGLKRRVFWTKLIMRLIFWWSPSPN